jgi:predicted porin
MARAVKGLGGVLLLGSLLSPGATLAQDTLQLYGRVDLNLTRIEGAGWEMTQASNSRIGLRGSEALAGGWAAVFQLESRVNADDGSVEKPRFWGRESWVGLRGRPATVRFGRTQTPSQRIAANYDPHSTDGIGSLGSAGLLVGQGALTRFDNGIYLDTAPVGGFTAHAAMQLAEGSGTSDRRARSMRLRLNTGPFDGSLGHATLDNGTRVSSIAAAVEIGGFKPMFQHHEGQRDGLRRTTTLLGGTLQLKSGEMRAAWSQSNDKEPTDIDRTLVAVGYDHRLSARTLLYATFAQDRVTGQAARPGFEAGIRHLF